MILWLLACGGGQPGASTWEDRGTPPGPTPVFARAEPAAYGDAVAWATEDRVVVARWSHGSWATRELEAVRPYRVELGPDAVLWEVRQSRRDGVWVASLPDLRQLGDSLVQAGRPRQVSLSSGPSVAISDGREVRVARWSGGWSPGPPLRARVDGRAVLDGRSVAWTDGRRVGLATMGAEWTGPDDPLCGTGDEPVSDLALHGDTVAFLENNDVVVCHAGQRLPSPGAVTRSHRPDLALDWPRIAWSEGGRVKVARWDEGWTPELDVAGSAPSMRAGCLSVIDGDVIHVRCVR